jgi:predicted Ser/Thr protein kinase
VTNADWTRVNELFHQALELPRDERGAFLAQACGGDEPLRLELTSLLDAHDEANDFIEQPATRPADLAEAGVSADLVGRTIGHYRIVRVLGVGGMGIVFLADDTRLGRPVALKALAARFTKDPQRRERLRREARAAAALAHPGIATVYALEEFDDHVYIAGEFVPGETLRDELGRGPLPASRVIDTAVALARALEAAHDRGVVHRDLKPENVIRTPAGDVKILDFGLARMRDVPQPAAEITAEGALLGTPAYMSPEQIRGDAVDFRTDLFALGIMLYELATGAHPFAGSNAASTIARILEIQPPHITDRVPAMLSTAVGLGDLDRIIARCLEKHPDARYQSTHDLVTALEFAEAGGAPKARHSAEAAAKGLLRRRALGWWQFHQAAASVGYLAMLLPLWLARSWTPGLPDAVLFLVGLAAALIATTLRLHVWFAVRELPEESGVQRVQAGRWIRLADVVFVIVLAVSSAFAFQGHVEMAVLFLTAAVGVLIAFAIVEPATARAAFGRPAEPRNLLR